MQLMAKTGFPDQDFAKLLSLDIEPSKQAVLQAVQSIPFDPLAWNSCFRGLAKAKRPDVAIAVLHVLEQTGCKVDTFHFNMALNSCEKASAWGRALALFSESADCYQADSFTYSTAISALGKGQKWRLALDLLACMSNKLEITGITYTAAMSACEKSGKWEAALKVLSRWCQQK